MTTEHRTGMEILEPPACWALLRRAQVGRLAVAIANHPDIFPINFVVDHASVVFRTAEGANWPGPSWVRPWPSRSMATTPGPVRHGAW